ncbi:unnamed protein product [Choristocarpus tenellus]
MLMKFIGSSLDMCKAELESVAYPVFAHCYLTLVANGFADHARRMMLTWGREHEWRYSQEVEQLHMVTLPDHLLTSEYAQEVSSGALYIMRNVPAMFPLSSVFGHLTTSNVPPVPPLSPKH